MFSPHPKAKGVRFGYIVGSISTHLKHYSMGQNKAPHLRSNVMQDSLKHVMSSLFIFGHLLSVVMYGIKVTNMSVLSTKQTEIPNLPNLNAA